MWGVPATPELHDSQAGQEVWYDAVERQDGVAPTREKMSSGTPKAKPKERKHREDDKVRGVDTVKPTAESSISYTSQTASVLNTPITEELSVDHPALRPSSRPYAFPIPTSRSRESDVADTRSTTPSTTPRPERKIVPIRRGDKGTPDERPAIRFLRRSTLGLPATLLTNKTGGDNDDKNNNNNNNNNNNAAAAAAINQPRNLATTTTTSSSSSSDQDQTQNHPTLLPAFPNLTPAETRLAHEAIAFITSLPLLAEKQRPGPTTSTTHDDLPTSLATDPAFVALADAAFKEEEKMEGRGGGTRERTIGGGVASAALRLAAATVRVRREGERECGGGWDDRAQRQRQQQQKQARVWEWLEGTGGGGGDLVERRAVLKREGEEEVERRLRFLGKGDGDEEKGGVAAAAKWMVVEADAGSCWTCKRLEAGVVAKAKALLAREVLCELDREERRWLESVVEGQGEGFPESLVRCEEHRGV